LGRGQLAQDTARWRVIMNKVMNIWVPKMGEGNLLPQWISNKHGTHRSELLEVILHIF